MKIKFKTTTLAFGLFTLLFISCNSAENRNDASKDEKTTPSIDTFKQDVPSAEMIAKEVKKQQDSLQAFTMNVTFETQDICANSSLPSGWIVTGGRWCPSCCGYSGGGIYNNVLTITRYNNLPVGTVMEVCAGQSTPPGWVVVGGRWCPTCCGYTSGGIYNNVIQIRRLN
ncbi:MAG: hypothetical protein IPN29_17510 [Saprospiraceae bacterium]|nr:hypothetical protein [Saprospiraceae bacterium]